MVNGYQIINHYHQERADVTSKLNSTLGYHKHTNEVNYSNYDLRYTVYHKHDNFKCHCNMQIALLL